LELSILNNSLRERERKRKKEGCREGGRREREREILGSCRFLI
jgi:hypothetical protein